MLLTWFFKVACIVVIDFILTEEQRKEMSLKEQLEDLREKLTLTQGIRSGSKSMLNCFLSTVIQSIVNKQFGHSIDFFVCETYNDYMVIIVWPLNRAYYEIY